MIVTNVRIQLRFEPPSEELHNVEGDVTANQMTHDRPEPRVGVANQHNEPRGRKYGQQVIDNELVRPSYVILKVEPGGPIMKIGPNGRWREFASSLSKDDLKRLRALGLMSSTVVGRQQPDE